MGSSKYVFEVCHGGRFDRHFGCEYVGGDISVHHVSYDPEDMSYAVIEEISEHYGYKAGDLMYFRDPEKSLTDGLHLVTSDDDVVFLCACHTRHSIVHLYRVSFEEGEVDEDKNDDDDDDADRGKIDRNDPWWNDKISDDENLFDVDVDAGHVGARPSIKDYSASNVEAVSERDEYDGPSIEEK